ncbi:hypothetical protein EDC02_7306 [Micromonospora sp. Llam0]|nr:hypothetical protein EDC02_7306 [Micromonospora sp. Llam0]
MSVTRLLNALVEPIASRRYVGRHRALGGTSFLFAIAQPI